MDRIAIIGAGELVKTFAPLRTEDMADTQALMTHNKLLALLATPDMELLQLSHPCS